MMLRTVLRATLLILTPLISLAAPHTTSTAALKIFLNQDQIQEVRALGPSGYRGLRALMFSNNESMKSRWQATMAAAKIAGKESFPELRRALSNANWYMRSAGLVAMQSVDSDAAAVEAKKIMRNDKAMMVRAAALKILQQSRQVDRPFLWGELKNRVNYRNGTSLSIRTTMIEALNRRPLFKEAPRFIAFLSDQDPNVRGAAQEGLEVIARESGSPDIYSSQSQWKSWWEQKKKK